MDGQATQAPIAYCYVRALTRPCYDGIGKGFLGVGGSKGSLWTTSLDEINLQVY